MSDDENGIDALDVEVVDVSTPSSDTKRLSIIWDDDKIERYTDNNGKKHWKCLWCGRSFQHWNATKALRHVNKQSGGDVRSCKSTTMDTAHKTEYKRLFDKLNERKTAQAQFITGKKRSSEEYMDTAVEMYTSTKRKKTPPSAAPSSISGGNSRQSNQIQTQLNFRTEETKNDTPNLDTHQPYQPKVTDSLEQQSEARLTMAIADLIHSCGLPFSLASHHKFQRVLQYAKQAPKNYTPPNRNLVAGKLLDLNYDIYKNQTIEMLLKDSDVYGITFFGDGATVRKSPLINILASSIHEPAGCLSIVDCTGHLQANGRKDATYISSLFIPHIIQMEEQVPKCTDLIIFDGAANVQKAGLLVETQFPHISVIHGAEHVISLFYSDIFRLEEFDILKRLNQYIYRFFGSGAMHSPYAIFSKHARDHNKGKSIGLIRASDTRMGGHVISMMRTLRLKDSLLNTLTSASFIQGNFKFEKKVDDLLKRDITWEIMSQLVRAVFPPLIVLRLTDQQEAFMDKLYFYVRKMDSTLVKSQDILDQVQKQSKQVSWSSLKDMNKKDLSGDNSSCSERENNSDTCTDDSDEDITLGTKVLDIWNKRRNKLINDFTIAGWLLSPIPEVYFDSCANMTGEHRDAVERLLKKMYASDMADDSDELAALLSDFWDEYEQFKSKTGPFEKSYIWKAGNIDIQQNGRSHLWHKKNSLPYTKVLGKFACRVCSKIVGMGSAERNWGDVKHLKTDKRSHLSSAAVQKQATIFGASCMHTARMERKSKQGTSDDPYKFWNDEDFDNEFATFAITKSNVMKDNVRVFKCYLEDWEKEHLHKKDDVTKAKFLQKYGGLEFDDVDHPIHYRIDNARLHFQRRTKNGGGGWCVCTTSDLSNDSDEDDNSEDENMDKFTTWSISENCALLDCIASYYTLNPQKNLKLVLRKGQAEEIAGLTSCGGCGKRATPHHKCDKCKKNMHTSCGRTIGTMSDRSTVRCPSCDGNKNSTSKRQSEEDNLAPCGKCGQETGSGHRCDICNCHMHTFCGRIIGEERYGASVRCPKCDIIN